MSFLTVVCPGQIAGERYARTLEFALKGRRAEILTHLTPERPLRGRRILFAVPLDETGINPGLYELLAVLRRAPHLLDGCVGGVLIDGAGDLYTKSAARELVLSANRAGCLFTGRPLVEATGDLRNFAVQAKNAGCTLGEAYRLAAADLAERILAFQPTKHTRPKITVLHASSHRTSNTLALWGGVRERLSGCCDITEIGLRNGTLEDCAGCPYTMCLHYGEKGDCFYGGVMVREVYPAIRETDALMMLCPNYNDTLSANLTACINRLTALYRAMPFTDKAVFGIVVSGYSGSDIVARQLVSSLCMNKGFWLPPRFCLLETANDPGAAASLPGIDERLGRFAGLIRAQLCV
jgi:multimeric flavodoxin WrbA